MNPDPQTVGACLAVILDLMHKTYVNPEVLARLDPDRPLFEQGLDSVDLPLMVLAVQERYGIAYTDAELGELQTLREFAALTATKAGLA